MMSWLGMVLVSGCEQAENEASLADIYINTAEAALYADALTDRADVVAPAGEGQLLVEEGGAVQLYDLRSAAPIDIGATALDAAINYDGILLASMDGSLWTYDGELAISPLDEALNAAPTQMVADDAGALWLLADTVYRWDAGVLQRLRFDEAGVTGPIATNGMLDGQPVTWLAHGDQAVAISADLTPIDSVAFEGIVSLHVDNAGAAWLNDGARLWVRTADASAWLEVAVPGNIQDVMGNPNGGLVWVRTSRGAWVGNAANGLAPAPVADGEWMAVDDGDRLLLRTDSGLERVSTTRWAVWRNVPATLSAVSTLGLELSTTADAEQVTLRVNGSAAAFEEAWGVTLDPNALGEGTVNLDATVTWPDGGESTASVSVAVLPAGSVNWTDDIAPIYQTSCASCHDASGTVTTLVLDSAQAWVDNFEPILDEVESGSMPLGPETLSDEQIALLLAWQDANFP